VPLRFEEIHHCACKLIAAFNHVNMRGSFHTSQRNPSLCTEAHLGTTIGVVVSAPIGFKFPETRLSSPPLVNASAFDEFKNDLLFS
jgi:hypothetical protein